jgi:hypothetical protein
VIATTRRKIAVEKGGRVEGSEQASEVVERSKLRLYDDVSIENENRKLMYAQLRLPHTNVRAHNWVGKKLFFESGRTWLF